MIIDNYYDIINYECISSAESIIPSTYKESKYIISFTTVTITGKLYYYFIDLFNISATQQRLSNISICNPIGCTNDFKPVFEKVEEDEDENRKHVVHPVYKNILKRFNKINIL